MICMPRGPIPALIMIVGEAPGEQEEKTGQPFVGPSGWELEKMLKEAGINMASCFITNVARHRPPRNNIDLWLSDRKTAPAPDWVRLHDKWVHPHIASGYEELLKEIELVQPDIIITLGNTSMWALSGNWGILKWRGSMLLHGGRKLLPTIHPAAILRSWELRCVAVQDLRRASLHLGAQWPAPGWNFLIRPTFEQASCGIARLCAIAQERELTLSVDIETRAYHIACLGIAWSSSEAICIPFLSFSKPGQHYWTAEEEAHIVFRLYILLTHPNVRVVGQNFIFDAQYIYRYWHFVPNFARDTMVAHHVCFPALPKGLSFICSFHNTHYVYWKDDGKTLSADHDEDKHWAYNCEDCVRTFEADASLQQTVDAMGLRGPHDFQQSLFHPVLKMMTRGILVDREQQAVLEKELEVEQARLQSEINYIVGYPLNPKSPKQMTQFFYYELAQPPVYKRKTQGEKPSLTCDSQALAKLATRQILLRPLVELIEELRSVGVFLSNYLGDKRDKDGRMRCSYNITGTKTFRFSSSENAFGSGLNLQTIPKGEEE